MSPLVSRASCGHLADWAISESLEGWEGLKHVDLYCCGIHLIDRGQCTLFILADCFL